MALPLLLATPALPATPAVDLASEVTTTTTASQGARIHKVRSGETIYDIAARYRVSPSALLARNQLSSREFIHPGQKLRIPARSGATSPSSSTKRKPARSGRTRTYVVRSGDTLSGIAARHHMSVDRLRSLNSTQGRFIHPGQKLRVTGTAPKPAKRTTSRPAATRTHTVRSGETLSGIAARHRMSVTRLAKLNHLSSRGFIHPGQKLKVTGTVSTPKKSTHKKSTATKTKKTKNNTFAGRTYSNSIVNAAHRNRSILANRAVPSRAQTKAKIIRISRRHGLDPSLALAISYQESGWNQRQVSVANAIGTMQVIPSSGQWASQMAGRKLDLLDTDDNITAGVLLLKVLTQQADTTSEAIAGYYQGLASVEANGMYKDTKQYVTNVRALRKRM